ncbi:hypothetical protein IQ07DRAFT_439335 [Pyrenochaeta sp. DS3sAY3a]|nr:hypothetical protein IQ07DRAFT_439335 [Pyrenochaeta sp. DS3sAY3a]
MRVIQDSDDELESDLESEIPQKLPDASKTQAVGDVSQSGTGSTESLKRAFQEAHRAQFQTQQSLPASPSLEALPDSASKSGPTLNEHAPLRSGIRDHHRTSMLVHENPEINSTCSLPNIDDDQLHHRALPDGASWTLEGIVRDNYTNNDPMILFPEPSSTIPNATLTQQRVLERITAPANLSGETEANAARIEQSPVPSLPWSEMMKFPSSCSNGQGVTPHESQVGTGLPISTVLNRPFEERASQRSQKSQRGSSAPQSSKPVNNDMRRGSMKEDIVTRNDQVRVMSLPDTAANMAPQTHQSTTKESLKSPKQPKSQIVSGLMSDDDDDDDDDLAATDTLNAYIPRPSRSRSLQIVAQQPVAHVTTSQRGRGSKRRKTTCTTDNTVSLTTPQKVELICDMGFSPSTTSRALEQNDGEVTRTVDWLITNNLGEDELASHHTSKRKRPSRKDKPGQVGDVKATPDLTYAQREDHRSATRSMLKSPIEDVAKGATEVQGVANGNVSAIYPEEHLKTPKVQVVIPKKSPYAVDGAKSETREIAIERLEVGSTAIDAPGLEVSLTKPVSVEGVREKKRSRGRPKKTMATAVPAVRVSEDLGRNLQDMHDGEQHHLTKLNSVVSNEHSAPLLDLTAPNREQQDATKERIVPEEKPKLATTTTGKQDIPTKQLSDSPSSKSGKVPYRVGLSRRARIAPLLRVVKK